MRIRLAGFCLAISSVLFGGNAFTQPLAAGQTSAGLAPSPGMEKIQHVIFILQENRSFDNYFGTFPGADGFPPSTCLPKLPGSSECVAPFHMPKGEPIWDLDHGWESEHAAYDNGRMDAFVWVHGTPYTMAYYDERDIPNYWAYARRFTLCDRFLSRICRCGVDRGPSKARVRRTCVCVSLYSTCHPSQRGEHRKGTARIRLLGCAREIGVGVPRQSGHRQPPTPAVYRDGRSATVNTRKCCRGRKSCCPVSTYPALDISDLT